VADPVDTANVLAGNVGVNPVSADVAAALDRIYRLPPGERYGGGNPAQMRDPAVAAVGNIAPVVAASAPPAAGSPAAAVDQNPALAPIRQRESGGDPNVGYGGVDLSKAPLGPNGFPQWEGKMGPAGISHAAGLYQIEPGTWNPIAAELGITDFSPQSQTRVANEIYKRYGVAPWDASAPGSSGRGGYGGFVRQQIESEKQAYSQHQAQIQQYLAQNRYVSEEQPKWTFKPPEFDAMKAFGSTASVLGILMGALTRGGITASLNASASAMTAIRQNDLMAYKEAKDTWEKNTELAIKNAKAHNEAVNRGLEIAKSNWGEYSAHMARVGALYGDLAKYEDPEAVEGRLIQRQTALLKFQQSQRDAQIESDNNLVDLNRAAEILGVKPEDLKTANPAQVAKAKESARLERAAAENVATHPETAANVLGKAHATAAVLRAQEQHREQWNAASSDQKAAWIAEADNELKAEQAATTAAARAGGKPKTAASNLIFKATGEIYPDKDADKIVSSIRSAQRIQRLIETSKDPDIEAGFGEIGSKLTGIKNWLSRNVTGRDKRDEVSVDGLENELSDLSGTDKFSVWYKQAMFDILEAERAARGGSLLPVGVLTRLTPLLDPKNLSGNSFRRIMKDRSQDMLEGTNLGKTDLTKLSDYMTTQQNGTPSVTPAAKTPAGGTPAATSVPPNVSVSGW